MKAFRHRQSGTAAVKNKWCAIGKQNGEYEYVIIPIIGSIYPFRIYKSNRKSDVLNKHTLNVVAVLFNILMLLSFPVVYMMAIIKRYFQGMYAFVIHSHDVTFVREFTWITMAALSVMIVLYILK